MPFRPWNISFPGTELHNPLWQDIMRWSAFGPHRGRCHPEEGLNVLRVICGERVREGSAFEDRLNFPRGIRFGEAQAVEGFRGIPMVAPQELMDLAALVGESRG